MCSIYCWKNKHFRLLNPQCNWQSDEWWAYHPENKCHNNPGKTSHLYRPQISTRLRTFMSFIFIGSIWMRSPKGKHILYSRQACAHIIYLVKKKNNEKCINILHEFHHSQIRRVYIVQYVCFVHIQFWQLYLSQWHARVKHVGH